MFGSEILEVAIGLILLYLLLSLMCSALNEWYARFVAMRATDLEKAIEALLIDQDMADKFYSHPLIKALAPTKKNDKKKIKPRRPSYIAPRTFAVVLMDIMTHNDLADNSTEIADVRKAIAESTSSKGELKRAVLALVNSTKTDVEKSQTNIENWFNDAMTRLSGSYKRKTQVIILIVASAIVILLNADTLMIANSLWRDNTLRASVVAAAQETAKQGLPSTSSGSLTKVVELQREVNQLNLPFGWVKTSANATDPRQVPPLTNPMGWFYKILGLLATAFALTLGAPFWFDTLNKFVNLRGTGKPSAETGVASEKKTTTS